MSDAWQYRMTSCNQAYLSLRARPGGVLQRAGLLKRPTYKLPNVAQSASSAKSWMTQIWPAFKLKRFAKTHKLKICSMRNSSTSPQLRKADREN